MDERTRTFVKICGMTRESDAQAAAAAGADAIGFVFAPGPRTVTAAQAASISSGLDRAVRRVGVFVDAPVEQVLEVADEAGLDAVQLHGTEDGSIVARIRQQRPLLAIYKAVRGARAEDVVAAAGLGVDAVLVDPKDPYAPAGRSQPIPMPALLSLSFARLIVAGGLTAGNVAEVVVVVRPWGLDVSGGVETSPGVKDHHALARFVEAVREAEAKAPAAP
ncbi:MAG: phosphoribosylanthranilate isomerase [Actinomycetota bacterium]